MYTRSYLGSGEGRQSLPENYDGVAFLEPNKPDAYENKDSNSEKQKCEEPCSANKTPSSNPWDAPTEKASLDDGVLAGLGKIPLLNGIAGLFKGRDGGFNLSKIGTEEILIIAAAIFLFLSKDGDNECAIMLLLLLLIN